MDALFSAIMNMFASDALKDAGGIQTLGNMQDAFSQFTKPAATPSPHDFQAPLSAPAPNPYASMLSMATQNPNLPQMPAAPELQMPSMRFGNLGMPNSQMTMPLNGQKLAAQAFGRFYS
jgi:hypothetical protein